MFFICILRAVSLMVQSLPRFKSTIEENVNLSSIFMILMMNLFEIVPILMFFRAMVIAGGYLRRGNQEQNLESSSMSTLMNALAPGVTWSEYE